MTADEAFAAVRAAGCVVAGLSEIGGRRPWRAWLRDGDGRSRPSGHGSTPAEALMDALRGGAFAEADIEADIFA